MIVKIGSYQTERLQFIAKRGDLKMAKKNQINKSDPDGVQEFCTKNGYAIIGARPVHKIMLERTCSAIKGKKKMPPVKDPLKIIKGLVLYTVERPVKATSGRHDFDRYELMPGHYAALRRTLKVIDKKNYAKLRRYQQKRLMKEIDHFFFGLYGGYGIDFNSYFIKLGNPKLFVKLNISNDIGYHK
jgi:hypothetical protein